MLIVLIVLLFKLALNLIGSDYGGDHDKFYEAYPLWVKFLALVVFTPVIETFIFQFLPYLILNQISFFKQKYGYIIFLSSAFFALLHYYSLVYILYSFLIGIVLMFAFIIRQKKEDAFLAVCLVHGMVNFVAVLEECL